SRAVLYRVPASGGRPEPLFPAASQSAPSQEYHRYPSSIAGTDQFLYLNFSVDPQRAGVYRASTSGMAAARVLPDMTQAYFVRDAAVGAGWIVFVRDGAVLAQPFHPAEARLSGDPVQLASDVGMARNTLRRGFSASSNGVLGTW